jgi:hypothetical protein
VDEKTARVIVEQYLARRQVRFRMHKERQAGPDALIDGVALEVKGSDLDEKETLKQLTRYASEFAGLIFAFPVDKLTLSLLYGLCYLEAAIEHIDVLKTRSIKLLLLAEMKGSYYAREYDSADKLRQEIDSKLSSKARLPYGAKPQEVEIQVSRQLVNLEAALPTVVMEELSAYPTLYKVEVSSSPRQS